MGFPYTVRGRVLKSPGSRMSLILDFTTGDKYSRQRKRVNSRYIPVYVLKIFRIKRDNFYSLGGVEKNIVNEVF